MRTFFLLLLIGLALGAVFCVPHHRNASSGQALIGGPFTLTDHKGETVTDQTFRGKYMLVYFGFTSCPMICPTDVAAISQAMTLLGDKAKEVQPLFITVDPARDTPGQLKTYLSNFHPSFVGLTGTKEQVDAAALAYKVYHAEAKDSSAPAGYTMNHSAYTYLMDKEGRYLTHFAHDMKPEDMAAGIAAYIK